MAAVDSAQIWPSRSIFRAGPSAGIDRTGRRDLYREEDGAIFTEKKMTVGRQNSHRRLGYIPHAFLLRR